MPKYACTRISIVSKISKAPPTRLMLRKKLAQLLIPSLRYSHNIFPNSSDHRFCNINSPYVHGNCHTASNLGSRAAGISRVSQETVPTARRSSSIGPQHDAGRNPGSGDRYLPPAPQLQRTSCCTLQLLTGCRAKGQTDRQTDRQTADRYTVIPAQSEKNTGHFAGHLKKIQDI